MQRLVDVLARSFADDPIIRWPFPTDGSHEDQCRELFRILDEPLAETGWLWEAGDGAGAALWIPPDGGERFLEIERGTRDAIDAMTIDGGVRYRAFWDWIEGHLPGDSWFLDHLAVAPERRGEGLGRALVDLGLGFARRDGVPAFLETARPGNVGYYERLGFRVVADEHAPGGGPRLWFMRSDP